ncbi:uncharacterized protein LOC128677639 [Plodia interpunctella]|uniref:uncharacterized protein LOC128677639 n=1 Tax=Plodia interpunctella TaxID=58824 RepID=UPI0023678A22|nr:uncharacterized protein LOC128677639 [Plodia interpunctella]
MLLTKFTLVFISLFCGIYSSPQSDMVKHCISYYTTGQSFEINDLQGEHFAVYFWPPNQRQRDNCAIVSYKKLMQNEVNTASECEGDLPEDGSVMHGQYINGAGRKVILLVYGDGEVKNLVRPCKSASKYIYKRINDNYVLGINCSSSGRGMLLARTLPSASEVQDVVDGIEIMSGREGKPDCNLRT